MYELLLFGQVSAHRLKQVSDIMSAVAMWYPRDFIERHAIYMPLIEPEEPGSHLGRADKQSIAGPTKSEQQKPQVLYHVKLIQPLIKDDFSSANATRSNTDNAAANAQPAQGTTAGATARQWSMVWTDVPDMGDRGVYVRKKEVIPIVEGDVHLSMVGMGYEFKREVYVEGEKFMHEGIEIRLERALYEPDVPLFEPEPRRELPEYSALAPYDSQNVYMYWATIEIDDEDDEELIGMAVNKLKEFQKMMRGCVNLFLPSRLEMDTRVKWQADRNAA